MTEANTLGARPAFPVPGLPEYESFNGLTIRQHYAGLAMQGLLANPGGPIQANRMSGWNFADCDENDAAALAVGIADALLAELAKEAKE